MIPFSIPPEAAVYPAQPKLFQSSTHPLDSLPLHDQAAGQDLRWIPAGCPIFDQFHFGTHPIPCSRSSQLSHFLDWLRQSPYSDIAVLGKELSLFLNSAVADLTILKFQNAYCLASC